MKHEITEMHRVLCGKKEFRELGIIKRLEDAEASISELLRDKWIQRGMCVVLPFLVSLLCYIWLNHGHEDSRKPALGITQNKANP